MQSGGASTYDLIIIGAGPAGCAAAVQVANLAPALARRTLVLDKARFPRVKICGGGLVRRADYLLARLGLQPEVRATHVHSARFLFPGRELTLHKRNMFRIVRRVEFDHALLQQAQARGVTIQQETAVLDLARTGDGVLVQTPHETLRARVVIGADGAGGLARKAIVRGPQRLSMVGLETFTDPVESERAPQLRHTAVLDFRCTAAGVEGYSWDFPVGSDDLPQVNRGIFHSHLSGRASRLSLKSYLMESLRDRGIVLEPGQIKGHPEHMYDPSLPCSAPHILLAGDAVGVEPLLGEGISSALETGMLAAEAACRAFQSADYSFREYSQEIRTSHKGRSMLLKRRAAERFHAGGARWWILVGAVGTSALHAVTSRLWEDVSRPRKTAWAY